MWKLLHERTTFAQNTIYPNIYRLTHFYRQTVQAASSISQDISLDYMRPGLY